MLPGYYVNVTELLPKQLDLEIWRFGDLEIF